MIEAASPFTVDSSQISGYPRIYKSGYPDIGAVMGTQPHIVIEPNRCNCSALRKASRRLSQLYDSAIAPSGLKSTQFAILVEINRREDQSPTIRELADALVMDQSTVGQNLRPLEREGLVSLVQDAADRRSRRVKLTRTGWSRLAAAQPLWNEVQAQFENGFGKRAAADLRGVLLNIARDQSFAGERGTSSS